jgi:hypothetical protein
VDRELLRPLTRIVLADSSKTVTVMPRPQSLGNPVRPEDLPQDRPEDRLRGSYLGLSMTVRVLMTEWDSATTALITSILATQLTIAVVPLLRLGNNRRGR